MAYNYTHFMGLTDLLYLNWLGTNTDLIQNPENIPEPRLQQNFSIYKPGERKEERIVPNTLVHAKEKDFRNGTVLYKKCPIQTLQRDVSGFDYIFCPGKIETNSENGGFYFTSLDEIPSFPPGYGLLYLPKGTRLKFHKGNIPDFFKMKKITFFDRLNSFGKHFIKHPYSELKVNIVGRTAYELKRYIQNSS
jgi:hypothetical protein